MEHLAVLREKIGRLRVEIAHIPVRKIGKNTPLFSSDNEEMMWINQRSLPTTREIRKLYDDFAVIKGGNYGCPPTFNRLTPAWNLNEPQQGHKPNVRCEPDTYDFFALRDIKAGEELTVEYSTYSEVPVVHGKASTPEEEM